MDNKFEKYNSIPKEKFAFATRSEDIHDVKFDTKPTTYAKDSFKRFCKNKSSVVAAIILGILIVLAIIVPEITGVDLDKVSATETFLPPKIFKAGTGFWDGTEHYENLIYDLDNETPAGYNSRAVLNLEIDEEPTLINTASAFAKGGYVMFENQVSDGVTVNFLRTDTVDITSTGGYYVDVALGNTADALGSKLGEYRIIFSNSEHTLVLKDWSTDYSSFRLNLSNKLTEEGLTALNGRLQFELKAEAGKYSYILLQSCVFSAENTITNQERLELISFTDASQMVLLAVENGITPAGYWQCTGRKGVFEAQAYFCSFDYDRYELVYGREDVVYAKSELDKLVEQGYCTYEYDRTTGELTFEILSDDCPIEGISSFKVNEITGRLQQVTGVAMRYKKMGYDKMPKFIFGTDANGVDVLTRLFKGLRTSLLLGVATFAVCFTFGLVWGAISGYFGGNVDLAMERFTDILVGIPWIIIMTLCIMHLGNNFGTFIIALCLTGWVGTASRTRSQFYRFKKMEHVLAARTLGASDWRLIFKHVLPNSLGTIITGAVMMIPSVIFSEATLAYLNLGLQGVPSFGVMLSENQKYIDSHTYLILIPSIVIALLEVCFNLFGNGLRDAVNPSLKGSEG